MGKWREAHVGVERDDVQIGGMEVWQHEWRRTGEGAVQLPHPSYRQQQHSFSICEIGPHDKPVRFAVAELSNGVWGFYVPV